MGKKLLITGVLICYFIFCHGATTGLSGKWSGSVKAPVDGNDLPLTYIFHVDGNKLAGIVMAHGEKMVINNGKINGANFAFTVTNDEGIVIPHEGKYCIDSVSMDLNYNGTKLHTTLRRDNSLAHNGIKANDFQSTGLDTLRLYDAHIDANEQVLNAIKQASKEDKNVLLEIGGNWCVWCLRFNDFLIKNPELDKYIHGNYVVVLINYSPENKNKKLLAKLGYPQRYGFPVFVVLDGAGKRLYIQNSSYLEENKDYNKDKVIGFLEGWSPNAVNSRTYKKGK